MPLTIEEKMKRLALFAAFCSALAAALAPFRVRGCTSWMVFSDLTKNGTNILHKNRDSANRKIIVCTSPENARRRWVALFGSGTNAVLNESGLAGTMNGGELCIDPPKLKGKKTTMKIVQVVLESCDTAEQAAAKLKELISAGDYSHGRSGSIFFFMDAKEGYICETTATTCSVQRCGTGFAVRASNWHNPGMALHSRNDVLRHLKGSARDYAAVAGLNKIIDARGAITLPDIFALSRQFKMPENSPLPRSVCGQSTNSAASIEIDRQYPRTLSTLYVTIGPPRHTVYVPIPIGVTKLHPAMKNRKWSAAAFERLKKYKLEAPIPAEWTEFEKSSMERYAKAKAKTRSLLDAGKEKEAAALLNFAAETIWRDAVKLLDIPMSSKGAETRPPL